MRPLLVIAALLVAAPPALAQARPDLAGALVRDVGCSESDARQNLNANIEAAAASDTSKDAIGAALDQISGAADVCAALRNAAAELATAYPAPADGQGGPPAPSALVAATLAEAERRAANLKFEVGPPPHNLTRGGKSASRPIS